jgi:hypothetical protein
MGHGVDPTVATIPGAAARSGDAWMAQLLLESVADPNNGNKVGVPSPVSTKTVRELERFAIRCTAKRTASPQASLIEPFGNPTWGYGNNGEAVRFAEQSPVIRSYEKGV